MQAVTAIERGVILPDVKRVAALVGCSTRTASSTLAKAVGSSQMVVLAGIPERGLLYLQV